MARVELAISTFARAGLNNPAGQVVTMAEGAQFDNDGHSILRVFFSPTVDDAIITIAPLEVTISGLGVSSVISLPSDPTTYLWFGPFDPTTFNHSGKVYVDTDKSVTMTVFREPH